MENKKVRVKQKGEENFGPPADPGAGAAADSVPGSGPVISVLERHQERRRSEIRTLDFRVDPEYLRSSAGATDEDTHFAKGAQDFDQEGERAFGVPAERSPARERVQETRFTALADLDESDPGVPAQYPFITRPVWCSS